jgi:DNA-binding transcriptional ArsR family regulator
MVMVILRIESARTARAHNISYFRYFLFSNMLIYTTVMTRKPRNQELIALEEKAEEASRLLTAMGNPKRLMVLCNMLDGEKSVGELADIAGLSSAALSQHLGKMRALSLVKTRREGQTIYYSLASREARTVLETLYRLFCAPA